MAESHSLEPQIKEMREPYDPPTVFGTISSVVKGRPLIRTIMHRDLRLRYHSSILGYLWTLIEPLLLAVCILSCFRNHKRLRRSKVSALGSYWHFNMVNVYKNH